jgi:Leucine-rich repeat (LRR) protein
MDHTKYLRVLQVHIFFSKSNQLAYGFKMGHRIKAVRERLDEIAANRIKFSFIELRTRTQFEHRKREDTHSFVRGKEVIGREDDMKAVKELLLDSDVKENVSIIPIIGIGGLGKTTLAQYVYNDEEVKKHFELRLWVCVSDPFDVKTIVAKLIESATKKRPESLEMDLLQSLLRAKIDGKRYLLVLDDVWNENRGTWLDLEKLLSGGLKGSKVLITTRSKRVAEITCTLPPYLLGGLSESNSWDLFKRISFKDGKEPKNPKLVEIGREIIKKCAQVPLAIRSIGSLLYFKNSEPDWLYFKDNELYKITQQDNSVFPILKLSYDHLPSQLKQCFAFCSLFPKDHEIEVDVLIQLWTAHGFIHWSDKTKCLEDVGREYFMDLLWRSFFQDIQRDEYGDIERCKMHDLIHDLAQLVAGDECIISNPDAENIVERTRHVAFYSLNLLRDTPTPLLKAHKMRTLFLPIPGPFFFGQVLQGNKSAYDTLISSFKCLRALNLSSSNIKKVPNSIGKLKHLRFLDLSRNPNIKLLPNSITKLQNLQTLRLERCVWLEELPEDITKLINLRHLVLYGCDNLTHMPHGLGKLTALQTLTQFTLGKKGSCVPKRKGGLAVLESLDELRGELHIIGLKHLRSSPLEAKAAILERKQYLLTLRLEFDDQDSDRAIENEEQLLRNLQPHPNLKELNIEGYAGVRLPGWVSSLSNLVSISISNCKWCQHIPPLDQFPFLKSLWLDNLRALEYLSNDANDVSSSSLETLHILWCYELRISLSPLFQHHTSLKDLRIVDCRELISNEDEEGTQWAGPTTLRLLSIEDVPNLVSLPRELRHVTTLQELEIRNCPALKSLPEWIGDLTSLQKLQIGNCPNLISLPEGMRRLTSLCVLRIVECPRLEKRCERGTGEDWPKIAHVSDFWSY